MKKIPTIFKRPVQGSSVVDEINEVCAWVFEGQGVATHKYDGTCVKIENGEYLKRREVKKGKKAPIDFIEEDYDVNTGKMMGWVPVWDSPENKYHMEGLGNLAHEEDGTYELIGPKVQGNPEKVSEHILVKHSTAPRFIVEDISYEGIKNMLSGMDIEGFVFHHPDGRMAKIKNKDFK
tara:strand:- start:106 stop:639 length:534 start_codon:yes stop_codon:yes gene_type:complete